MSDTARVAVRGGVVLVDAEDEDVLGPGWAVEHDGRVNYARRRLRAGEPGGPACVRLHRAIMERVVGRPLSRREHVDHINHDGLDNRRCNLRLATPAQNQQHSRKRAGTSSRHKGVSFHKGTGRWQAYIRVGGKRLSLGYYESERDATRAYNAEAALRFGDYAVLNDLRGKP